MKKRLFNPYRIFVGIMIPRGLLELPISNSAKVLWGVLNSHCGEKGVVYPSQETLAGEMGCSVRNIQDLLQRLVDENLIVKIPPKGREKLLHFNNKYRFVWQSWMNGALKDDVDEPELEEVEVPE